MSTCRQDLIGSWELLEYTATNIDDKTDVYYPLGSACRGRIIYTADGYLSAYLQQADIMPYSVDWQSCLVPPQAELSAAASRTLAYTGRFEVEPGQTGRTLKVLHIITLSLPANWNGTTQVRLASVAEESGVQVLSLRRETAAEIYGARREVRLKWTRPAAVAQKAVGAKL